MPSVLADVVERLDRYCRAESSVQTLSTSCINDASVSPAIQAGSDDRKAASTPSGPIATMSAMDEQARAKLTRLTPDELAALRRLPRIKDPKERLAAVRRATKGLRVGVEVTRSFYRPS